MNKQEVFDKVATHLLTQMRRCREFGTRGHCAYRGPDGMKCAIGVLIPDDLYDPDLNTKMVQTEEVLGILFNAGVLTDTESNLSHLSSVPAINFLIYLQRIHDCASPDNWADELRYFANEYNLNTAAVDKFQDKEKV